MALSKSQDRIDIGGDQADSAVRCWRDDSVAHIRFNRPTTLNAVDRAMAHAFLQACRALAEDPTVRVVILSAEGRAFIAGGDLAAMQSDPVGVSAGVIADMHAAIGLLAALPAPVIAAVHDVVAGGGVGVALGCDLVIAAEGTRFNVASPLIGASLDCATSWQLPRCVGLRKALELALLCEPIDADEALRLGLVNRVVAADRLSEEVDAIAHKLAHGAPLALAHVKRLLRQSDQHDLNSQLQAEAQSFAACVSSADFAEGVGAFLAKRPARFQGR